VDGEEEMSNALHNLLKSSSEVQIKAGIELRRLSYKKYKLIHDRARKVISLISEDVKETTNER
jgi:hypothetical protein